MTVLYAGKRAEGANDAHKLPAFLASWGWVAACRNSFADICGPDGTGWLVQPLLPLGIRGRVRLWIFGGSACPTIFVEALGPRQGVVERYEVAGIGTGGGSPIGRRSRCPRGIVLHRADCIYSDFAGDRGGGLRHRTDSVFAPLAVLLLLTIPLPYTLQAIVTVKLQLLSTQIGEAAIRLFGIPVFVEGNVIDLGQYKLQVAEACSGLRYLLPLTAISFILAYLYKAPFWKKAILVASAAPITILINSFRIAVIAVLVDNFGTQMAEGFLHQFEGWVVFIFGALLLGLEMLALERFRFANVNVDLVLGSRIAASGVAKPISFSM